MSSKISKGDFNLYFSIVAFATGLIALINGAHFFTSEGLIETLAFFMPAVYWVSTIAKGYIISIYQDSNYKPSKKRKLFHDLLVKAIVYFLVPTSLNLMYAAFLLGFAKLIAPEKMSWFAQVIWNISGFNDKYIKNPVAVLFFLLAGFSALKYIAHNTFNQLKKIKSAWLYPLKVVSVTCLFINLDTGVNQKYFEWKLNAHKLETLEGKASFNVSKKQDKEIKAFIRDFIDYALRDLDTRGIKLEARADSNYTAQQFYIDIQAIMAAYKIDKTIPEDIIKSTYQPGRIFDDKEKNAISFSIDEKKGTPQEKSKHSKAYDLATELGEKLEALRAMFNNEEKSVYSRHKSAEQELFEDNLAEGFETGEFGDKVKNSTGFGNLAADGAAEFGKDLLIALTYVLNDAVHDDWTTSKMAALKSYLIVYYKEPLQSILASIKIQLLAVRDLAVEIKKGVLFKEQTPRYIREKDIVALRELAAKYSSDPKNEFYKSLVSLYDFQKSREARYLKLVNLDLIKLMANTKEYKDAGLPNEKELSNYNRDLQYELAKDADKPDTWKEFIRKFPNDARNSVVRKRIYEIENREQISLAQQLKATKELEAWEKQKEAIEAQKKANECPLKSLSAKPARSQSNDASSSTCPRPNQHEYATTFGAGAASATGRMIMERATATAARQSLGRTIWRALLRGFRI